MTAMLKRLYHVLGQDGVSGAALLLVAGRTVGFVAAFAIPVVLARTFDQAAFGTYKQLFLIYATFYGLAQLGAAESLYYFVPRSAERSGPPGRQRARDALAHRHRVLRRALLRALCDRGVAVERGAGVETCRCSACFWRSCWWRRRFEIVMVSRKEHTAGACVYAASDVVRTVLFLVPAFVVGSLRSVLAGAVVFAGLRLVAMLAYFWREFGRGFRIDAALWRESARVCAAVRAGRGHRGRAGQLPPVGGRGQVRRRDVRDLRGWLPADSADRSGLHVDRAT